MGRVTVAAEPPSAIVSRQPVIVWIATGLSEQVTGIQRIVLNTVAAWCAMTNAQNLILVDQGATWMEPLEAIVPVIRVPRAKGAVARAPQLPTRICRHSRIVAHSFGAPFPSQLPPATHKSYTVHDWSPFCDRAMGAAPRLAWAWAITRGVRSAQLPHFMAQTMAYEAPHLLRQMVGRKAIIAGLPYPASSRSQMRDVAVRAPRTPGLILSVGTNIPRKRFTFVADACNDLDGVEFVAAGDGTERLSHLGSRGGASGAKGLGHVTDSALETLYTTAALFVLASSYEGFGLPVLEAWEAGCPILVTDAVAKRLPAEIRQAATIVPTDVNTKQLASLEAPIAG
jgi:glycosyltransferase involved in cell wall biosynthesis